MGKQSLKASVLRVFHVEAAGERPVGHVIWMLWVVVGVFVLWTIIALLAR